MLASDTAGRRALAEHDVGRAGLGTAGVAVGGADEDLRLAVAVQVAHRADDEPRAVARRLADDLEAARAGGDVAQPDLRKGRLAPDDVGRAGVRAAGIVARRADDNLGLAVAVQVGDRGDRRARLVSRRLALHDEAVGAAGGGICEIDAAGCGLAPDHEGRTGIGRRAVLHAGRADQDLAAAVAVQVGDAPDRRPGAVAAMHAVDDQRRQRVGDHRAGAGRRRSEMDEDAPGIDCLVVVARRADDEVGNAVAIEVGDAGEPARARRRRYGVAEVAARIGQEADRLGRGQGSGEIDLGFSGRARGASLEFVIAR
jgi:hypothetical protein